MRTDLLLWSAALTIIGLLYARWEYRKRGKLGLLGLLLLCAMIFMPNLMLHYSIDYGLSGTMLDYLGIVLVVAGLAMMLTGILHFRSMAKMLCLDAGRLTLSGPYRWGRNPQYVGFWLFLLGFTLTGWGWWCLVPLLVQALNLHLLVLVEEEHLRRMFGAPYVEFCSKVPRYLGRIRSDS
jgi:protein-S-isoprenylcysteine O-methyltransferase Ste14